MKDLIARRYLISGRVQAVGFRYFTEHHAREKNIAGWVRNLADGRVEVHAEGPPERLKEFEQDLREGPRWAEVRGFEVLEAAPLRSGRFEIR
ncbi:MAG TPA: acylphosphatase [Bryobacteraceae bacterium]|nr:acylphosphatase [Bryobacteraceae bacterium]